MVRAAPRADAARRRAVWRAVERAAARAGPHRARPRRARRRHLSRRLRIDLQFPSFTDGRAYSQAYLLRKRFGFAGDLRATGDVLVDQLLLMERTGFSSAVLGDGTDIEDARRQLDRFPGFYQRDARTERPQRDATSNADRTDRTPRAPQ
ncbi:DUF934 domain-containing protein [Burkholderia pseudomultivorans]|uniref:DUF934 domain-containing protein n=1 Tax=Burkholderia pseudomultivorans TaxID=1207504 RepID=UPI003857D4A5